MEAVWERTDVKSGNFSLIIVAAFLAWAGWIVLDMSSGATGSSTSSSLSVVKTATVPVLVEFYADWCGPCKQVGPVVEALSNELGSKGRVVRINVDQQPALAGEHGIRGIPAFIAYRNGREIRRESGAIPKALMLEMMGLK